MKHLKSVEFKKCWHWVWRRLYCLQDMRKSEIWSSDIEFIDAGYCLDRYTLEH